MQCDGQQVKKGQIFAADERGGKFEEFGRGASGDLGFIGRKEMQWVVGDGAIDRRTVESPSADRRSERNDFDRPPWRRTEPRQLLFQLHELPMISPSRHRC